jgi:hypothetical protein
MDAGGVPLKHWYPSKIQNSITSLKTAISVAKSNKISLKIYMSQEAQLIITCISSLNGMGRGLKLFNIGKSPVISVCEEDNDDDMWVAVGGCQDISYNCTNK